MFLNVLIINKQSLLSEAIIEHHHIHICDEVDEEGKNRGYWVECTFCNDWYHLDCSGALECPYSNLEEFDFYI